MDQVIRTMYRISIDTRQILPPSTDVHFVDYLLRCVATYSNIPLNRLFGKSRKREVVQARNLAMLLIYRYTNMNLTDIGKKFGARDHTTVIHALNTWVDLFDTNDPITVDFVLPIISDYDNTFSVLRKRGKKGMHHHNI